MRGDVWRIYEDKIPARRLINSFLEVARTERGPLQHLGCMFKVVGFKHYFRLCPYRNIELTLLVDAVQPVPAGTIQVKKLRSSFVSSFTQSCPLFVVVTLTVAAMPDLSPARSAPPR